MSALRRLCVFCGSSVGERPEYAARARELGRELAQRGVGIVYGGGNVGLMGVLADEALAAGGEVTGVIPYGLVVREVAHAHLTRMHVVRSMHERKARMAELADGFVALPGGYGTFEELLEIVTWAQLGMHAKPIVVLDVADYYAPLFQLLDRGVAEGFLRRENRALVQRARTVPELFDLLERHTPHAVEKWIDRETS
ncbi:MAG: TIGR00730 family Rossman fold protein [Planctomycetes bacterium]|nr:TIGR00730 family Rossman fold protein [Planctomycetota bacterium]